MQFYIRKILCFKPVLKRIKNYKRFLIKNIMLIINHYYTFRHLNCTHDPKHKYHLLSQKKIIKYIYIMN